MIAAWVILGIVFVGVIAGIVSYNRFVSQRQMIKDAFANIDTELRRRYDLIPNLVETVRGYAAHERGVFESVTQARANAINAQGPAQQAQAENILTGALKSLFAVAEAYPDLKANENFLALQAELSNTEDRIQTSRRFYNSNVRQFNERVQKFPSSIIANMFDFELEQYFEVEEELREAGAPKVDFSAPPSVEGVTPPAAPPTATPEGGQSSSPPAPPQPPAPQE
jgi:LemA protein